MKLTDTKVRNFKAKDNDYKISDGDGLFVLVKKSGSKLWRMAYRFDGKQKTLSFGKYPQVSLAMARERRLEAKRLLADGFDPMAKKHEEKLADAEVSRNTFRKISSELIDKKKREGRASATIKKMEWYSQIACDDFGDKPIKEITAQIVWEMLKRREAMGHYETANKLRIFVGQVFRFAVATSRADTDPTFALKGALVSHEPDNMPAIVDAERFGELVRSIWSFERGGVSVRAALKLLVLLYSRPSELRLAKWEEFDCDKALWTIPKERMKSRADHMKPLSKFAIEILRELRSYGFQSEFVFASPLKPVQPICENGMNQSLVRMGIPADEHVPHGFRSSASSLLNESGLWNPDAIEAELAHKTEDIIRGTYMRTRFWDERVRMTEWWSETIQRILVSA